MSARSVSLSIAIVLLASSGVASASAVTEAPSSPRPWLRTVIDRGLTLAKRHVQSGTDAEVRWRSEAKALIDDTLDWQELTEQALGRRWKELDEKQRKAFSTLLREMVEASYQSKLKLVTGPDVKKPDQVTIEWLDEKQEGDEAVVTARGKSEKNGAVFSFRMKWKNGRWRVWDVAIDDVSTVRNYRTQFNQIIGKEGFEALLDRMRKKTEDIRTGRSELGP